MHVHRDLINLCFWSVVVGLGRHRSERQEQFCIAIASIALGPRHAFYFHLNKVLDPAALDHEIDNACNPYHAEKGRRSIATGVSFRMLLIDYLKGIDSQPGIAWRCEDSRSLNRFLGYGPDDSSPDHSDLTVIRQRIPMGVHDQAFQPVLKVVADHSLIKRDLVGINATDLKANTAMKSIVRHNPGDAWCEYLSKLYEGEAAISDSDDEEIRHTTRVVGASPDGKRALMLAAGRIRHITGTNWGTRRYLNMNRSHQLEKPTY
jgi:transposase